MDDLQRIKELTEELTKAADSYYNTGIELMSNYEYDAKFDELQELEEKYGITDGFTSRVGSDEKIDRPEIKHEYEAKSLGKTKKIEDVLSQHKDPNHQYVCLSWKLDGSTIQLTYDKGKLQLGATRGNGEVGYDITDNTPFIKGIPQTIPFQGKLTVRGEALMSYAEFERLNTDNTYANARNLANATISVKDKSIIQNREILFKAFKLVHSDPPIDISSFSAQLDHLNKDLGFDVVEHKRVHVKDLPKAMEEWSTEEELERIGVPVDGLVIAGDDTEYTKNLVGTNHHPNKTEGMAFKWQDETAKTTITNITWQVGRTGVITPVAIFNPVKLEGTTVSRATLNNVSYILNKDLRIGDEITVFKANKIIPQVEKNLSRNNPDRYKATENNKQYIYNIPYKCPCCQKPTHIKENKESNIITLNCENEKCPARNLQKYDHMFSKDGLNIEGLAINTIEMLLNEGYLNNPSDIYSLKDKRDELIDKGLFGEKSMDNLLKSIEKSKQTDFQHYMYSQGIPGFGKGQIKVLKAYLEDLIKDEQKPQTIYEKFHSMFEEDLWKINKDENGISRFGQFKMVDWTVIDGIGQKLSDNLNNWWHNQMKNNTMEFASMQKELVFTDKVTDFTKASFDNQINGKTFCITGSLESFENRDKAFEFITQNGGKTSTSVSAKTDYLVNNDINSTSSKNAKAKSLNIPIITEKELISMAQPMKDLTSPIKEDDSYER